MPPGVYLSRRPRVVQTAAMLFTDDAGRVLLVHQAYRADGLWSWPGGGCEDDERPRDAARRETREEIGLHVDPGQLLTVCSNSAAGRLPVTNFLFDGGTLTTAQIAAITPADGEVDRYGFFTPEQAVPLLSVRGRGELGAALQARARGTGGIYLENGHRLAIRGGA
ncbi:MAG: hypothetical protein AUG49_22420 [Catenulispora sp. 13_1_20CM_3_70_7]|nr:MAG: hypothetical protein AUG49_22420 [Catenulispora sp. 13_1_20CM_3_70_7]